jgi:hypothetical protein
MQVAAFIGPQLLSRLLVKVNTKEVHRQISLLTIVEPAIQCIPVGKYVKIAATSTQPLLASLHLDTEPST